MSLGSLGSLGPRPSLPACAPSPRRVAHSCVASSHVAATRDAGSTHDILRKSTKQNRASWQKILACSDKLSRLPQRKNWNAMESSGFFHKHVSLIRYLRASPPLLQRYITWKRPAADQQRLTQGNLTLCNGRSLGSAAAFDAAELTHCDSPHRTHRKTDIDEIVGKCWKCFPVPSSSFSIDSSLTHH